MANDISVTPVPPLPRSGFSFPDFAPPPFLEPWRCNLTALSHTENLYFVAGRGNIFVYQPNFPDQRLNTHPSLILQPTGPMYDPEFFPGETLQSIRFINHLIVDFLGNEEIVLVALHNGGVVGYHVSQIQQAIEKRQEPDCVETIFGDDVPGFLRDGVRKSAWGLAVHREARMIAVSSNTHTVTIFAFALDRQDAPSSGPWFRNRSEQRKVELPNTGSNIPTVAFCNTADDPEGRWLMTADINGVARIFDLALVGSVVDPCVHETAPRFCVQFPAEGISECICRTLNDQSHDYCHATWGALWLDSRAFKRVNDFKEALGCEANVIESDPDHVAFDCTSRRAMVPNSSTNWQLDPSLPPEEPPDGFWMRRKQCWRKLANEFETDTPVGEMLPSTSPIMLLSIRDLILLQPLKAGIEPDEIAYHNPFYQTISLDDENYFVRQQDRMNLYAQIPELGVVIVGSAGGRVAVLSLTQTSSNRPGGKTYACRIDHILPTREQERKGERPAASLAGIAVGPIQGMLGRAANQPRRWRLLMMYHDREMLRYEISKRTEEGASRAQAVSELII
ncbi:uncharacterized protein IWZ02DRAFT_443875 [Phyllosticta citriasiana]|uniref:uncharacterized protein n=1 Tax=Phyllosticta citriasiana TaxID=595635 RepID=UPI0030FD8999